MDVLVIGAKGMLGSDLVTELRSRSWNTAAVDVQELDITNPEAVASLAAGEFGKPEWCFNCAAYTAVDKAETERDAAVLVNGVAPGYLARACAMAGIRLVHISTDFVFDGASGDPYEEDAPTHPIGAYGESKLIGEEAVLSNGGDALIVRTAWLYGPNGNSFPKTMIRSWLAGKNLRVVSDQTGTPTYTGELARVLADLAAANPDGGIYHAAGPDIVTWRDVACEAIDAYSRIILAKEIKANVEPISTADWPTPAKRPMYSALSFEKVAALGISPMKSLSASLQEFVKRLGPLT